MHEMGIVLEIIDIVVASIPAHLKDVRVERVNLEVGKLSAIVPESLRFCFEIATKDTRVEGATLVIEEIPVQARCNDCQTEWTIEGPVFSCKACGSGKVELLSGRELDIKSIEIAEKESNHADHCA
ncbi:MAG: hydrogenase maturation nickel metallochaperone HypA [Desulfobacterales bacterium]|nr:hydrogenase maturation nickel metallochaperone HypA [Desulfobacterales bacterium]